MMLAKKELRIVQTYNRVKIQLKVKKIHRSCLSHLIHEKEAFIYEIIHPRTFKFAYISFHREKTLTQNDIWRINCFFKS